MPKLLFSRIVFSQLKGADKKKQTNNESSPSVLILEETKRPSRAAPRVSAEEQMTACQPFDALLRDESFLSAFHAFLRKEFSEENILFWKACEGLKKLDVPDELPSKAVEIYNKFIQPRAPKEINIDHQTREVIKLHLQMPDISCFDVAQKQIFSLMEKDSYPRFIKSEIYLNIVNKPK
ncbi:regulator of G-protein signaling 21-like [Erpetoichthys calabaricus]|uniref:Regulator of G protein signaling 1 n=1 Tax=Erpetoichthys calabaricus TaxID=27687 RepID=A0A8C4SJ00_ERPCA|nr:regulator of G-protein signaling 21-like [Erpetoichthys calabaricus]